MVFAVPDTAGLLPSINSRAQGTSASLKPTSLLDVRGKSGFAQAAGGGGSPERKEQSLYTGNQLTKLEKIETLLPRDGQPFNANSGTSNRSAKLQVVADFTDIEEHIFQVPGHRNLLHRVGELSL